MPRSCENNLGVYEPDDDDDESHEPQQRDLFLYGDDDSPDDELAACAECGHEYDEHAAKCPICGRLHEKANGGRSVFITILALLVLLSVAIASRLLG